MPVTPIKTTYNDSLPPRVRVLVLGGGIPMYEIFLPAGSTTSFRLPDVPAALTKYDPASVSGGSVDLIDQEGVNTWSGFAIFNVGQLGSFGFTQSQSDSP